MKLEKLSVWMIGLALVVTPAAVASAQEPALVSVGHGIPGEDVGLDPALPVDLIVDGACFYHDLEFGDFIGPVELAAGTYSVAVALSDGDPVLCDGTVVIGPVDIPFEAGDNATIFAHLTDAGVPTATVFDNDVSNVVAGKTRLTVRHTANAPAVDIVLNRGRMGGRFIAEILGLANPNEAGPVDLRPGSYAVSVFESGTENLVFYVQPFVTAPRVSQIVYAVGSLDNETFTVLVQTFNLGFDPPGLARR